MSVKLENISFDYNGRKILDSFNLEFPTHSFSSIVGTSGCGKTTLLNIISGVEKNFCGSIQYNFPNYHEKTPISYMTQENLLIPFYSVYENLTLILKIQGLENQNDKKYLDDLLKNFRLEQYLHYKPSQLSVGMKQKVALIRSFLILSPLMLLDEPFCALDYITRQYFIQELSFFQQKKQRTTILVTHDIDEAIFLSDVIYIFDRNGQGVKKLSVHLDQEKNIFETPLSSKFQKYKKELFQLIQSLSI